MNEIQEAHKILKGILDNLGFESTVEELQTDEGPSLQIQSADSSYIIGRNGDRLDDLQYLVNRVLTKKEDGATRVRIDCCGYREEHEKKLTELALSAAQKVRESGRPFHVKPLNAYHRRIVYSALVGMDDIKTSSEEGNARMKRILIEMK